MGYVLKKNLVAGHQMKTQQERFITVEQLSAVLSAAEKSGNPHRRRDHACIYLGFFLALRGGECARLHRSWFRDLDKGVVYVARLKRSEKIRWVCPACGKRVRVGSSRSGKQHKCPKCWQVNSVTPAEPPTGERALVPLPVLETKVLDYCKQYLDSLRKDQDWLIESSPGQHVSERMIRYIWQTYSTAAGLSVKVSYHALRHGRGVQIWDLWQDQQMVREMLGHASMSASQIYIHMSPKTLDLRRQQLDAMAKEQPQ